MSEDDVLPRMPFLGVSSLDLGRFTKVIPAFFLEPQQGLKVGACSLLKMALHGFCTLFANSASLTSESGNSPLGEANAHLIAASPDLYASLAEIVAEWGYPNTPKWHRARAALAKARGESLPSPEGK